MALRSVGQPIDLLLIVAAAMSPFIGGCSGAQIERLDAELSRQREEISELRRNQAAQRVQFDEFRNRLVVLQDKLESERIAAERTARNVDPEPVPSLPRVVVPSPESEPPPAPAQPEQAPRTVVIGPDGVPHVEPAPGGRETPAPKAAGPRVASRDAPPQEGNTAEEAAASAYRAAKSLLDAGQLDQARAAFEGFLAAHPDHPLSDNALYWIGETWYAKALWLKAAGVFSQVVERFPRGNKVPDAMLKTALCYKNLGERDLTRDVLRQLVRLYPSTSAAELAREQLSRFEAKP